MEKFYVATSIPYVNAAPHIGFALEIIQADVIARHQRQLGKKVFFLTGTDEHGAKISRAAEKAGSSPEQFTDGISEKFRELAKALNISNDDFIRTSDKRRHWPSAQKVWEGLLRNGDLEKREYKGLYCVGCEAFITSKDIENGVCRLHKTKPEAIEEENWFFKLSSYTDQIREAIESGRLEIVPASRKNEMLAFMKDGLQDVSFSRPSKDLSWGVPVPGDSEQTMYVWADALSNYISALGYPEGKKFKEFWPADVQIVGKDILRFHATIWPGMLLALNLPLPATILVHGFLTVEGQKMSKSLGNVVNPFELIEKYGADAVRYFLLREIPSSEDGDFSEEKFETRYNADLAAGLGNLTARVLALAAQHGVLAAEGELRDAVKKVEEKRDAALARFQFGSALLAIWDFLTVCDKHIEEKKPWKESEESKGVIADLMFALGEIGDMLQPFLPETSEKILAQLKTGKGEALFPRLDRIS